MAAALSAREPASSPTALPAARMTATDIGLLLIRLVLAIVFMYHGSQKLFGAFGGPGISGFAAGLEKMGMPMPAVGAWLAACAEFFGGAALLLGWSVRLAVIPMIVTMLVAAFKVHGKAFSLQHGGMEYALTLAIVLLGLLFTGGGRLRIGGSSRPARPLSSM